MKKPLLVLFVFVLFTLNCSAFAEYEYDSNQSRIGRLPCPLVLKNCTTIQALEENEYLPPKEEGRSESEYEVDIIVTYGSTYIENACKSCVVKLSRDSKCINRGLNKCRKNF